MLLWQDNETDTSGESGPADKMVTGLGSGTNNLIPQLMDPTLPIASKGVKFYASTSDVMNQIDSSIVTVDNAMQSIINTMGQGENLAAGIKKNFAEASLSIIQMGGSEKEALQIQTETLEVLGRNTTLSKEQYKTLFATSKVTGQSVKDLSTSMLDIGGNIDQIGSEMEDVLSRANSLGVNAKAVTEKVVDNMEQMNRFGFQGGIDGLARMASKAQVLRFDMSEVFELADNLLSPEKAIEMASALQRLGATTTSLIDPLRLMDLAQNDVGELQNQLGELFKTYTFFDEETKRFQIMPSARRDLKQLSQDLGIPLKEIEKMALGAADLDRKMSEIDFSGLDVEPDTRELIANMATMNKEGKYTIKNEAGVDEDLSTFIENYSNREEELKNFLQQQEEESGKTNEQKMLERADGQLSHLKKIEASNEAAAKSLSLAIGGSKLSTSVLDAQVKINKAANDAIIKGFSETDFLQKLDSAGVKLEDAVKLMTSGDLKKGTLDSLEAFKDFGKSIVLQTGTVLLDALKYFENPGTLKVTLYGDKTDNTKKIENAVAEPKQIESENTENQNKLFDVSLSQLENTINLVSLMERMVVLSENSNKTNESSLTESVNYYNEKKINNEKTDLTNNQISNESNNVSVINQNFAEYLQTQKVDAENLRETFREMSEKQIQVIKENYTQTEINTFKSKETGEEKTLTQLMEPFKDFAVESIQNLLLKPSESINSFDDVVKNLKKMTDKGNTTPLQAVPTESFVETKNIINTNLNQIKNQLTDQVGDKMTSSFSNIDQTLQSTSQAINNVILNNLKTENNNENVLQPQIISSVDGESKIKTTENEIFKEFVEIQKNEIQKTKEDISKVFSSFEENYNTTEKGTFISKETSRENILQPMTESVKDIDTKKIENVINKISETSQEIEGQKPSLGQNTSVDSTSNITREFFEFLKITASDVPKIFSEKENVENNTLVTNTSENVKISDTEKSITSYLNQKVQPLSEQTSPAVSRILSQSNDSIVTTLSEIDKTNKETISSTTELNKNLNDKIQIDTQTKDNFTTTVDSLITQDKSLTNILKNQTNTTTEELLTQTQVPEFIESQTPIYKPLENFNVEKYFEKVEKTTVEKTGKLEQTVKFDSPLPIKIEVTGMPQNNPEATEAFLTAISRDRRFGIAMEKAITSRNFNLVEKMS